MIDFETKSRIDLRKYGSYRYISDSSTEVICCSIFIAGDEGCEIISEVSQEKIQKILQHYSSKPTILIAHNALFEYLILNKFYKKYVNFDNIVLEDTQVYAMQLGLPPKLEKLALALGVSKKDVDLGNRLILKYSKPNKKGEFKEITPEVLQDYVKYCEQDVKTTYECYHWFKVNKVSMIRNQFMDTIKLNNRGIPLDIELIDKMIELRDKYLGMCLIDIKQLGIDNPNSTKQIKAFCVSRGLELLNVQEATVTEYLSKDDLHPQIRQLFEYRQKASLSSLAKLDTAKGALMPDKTIKGCFVYHGATTGRDSGRLVQPQNIPRGIKMDESFYDSVKKDNLDNLTWLYGEPTTLFKNALRGIIYHKDGLYIGDFASIEARVLLWLCDDPNLSDFKNNIDIYKVFAADIYNKDIKDITSEERHVGKTAVLGLGFGLGAQYGFKTQCEKNHIDMSDKDRQRVVNIYRKKFKQVVKFWREVERAFCYVTTSRHSIRLKNLIFSSYNNIVKIWLPSGRKIYFNKVKIGNEGITYWRGDKNKNWVEMQTYGSKLVQNIVQAIAYDFMIISFINLENQGFEIVARVHDELVATDALNRNISVFEQIMSKPPTWAEDFPLKVEAQKVKRYSKC